MVNSGLDIASSLVSIHCPILYCGYFVAIFASLQLLGSNVAVNADGFAAGYFGSLACEKTALFKPMLYSPAFHFSSGYPLGFGFLAGLCLLALRQFLAFLQAVRRLGGAVLFRGLRPSSSWGFPFWLLWLTGQSSRPAFGGRLTFVR